MKEIKLKSFDNKNIHLYIWDNVKNPKAVLQIVHGSAEHMKRYETFAKFLNANNLIVIGNDHRGHGKTIDIREDIGFFAKKNGWNKLVDDLKVVNNFIYKNYSNSNIMMFGHSMGSFLVRHYITLYSNTIKAAIICGTAWNPVIQVWFAKQIASFISKFKSLKKPCDFIHNLSYKKFSKKINIKDNDLAWLSRDIEVQNNFLKDPLSGQVFTASAFKDMFNGLLYIYKKKNIIKTRKDLPLFFIAGENDPVGNLGKWVKKTANKYKKLNFSYIDIKLYPEMRHEILNEINKEIVYEDILNFLNNNLENKELKNE